MKKFLISIYFILLFFSTFVSAETNFVRPSIHPLVSLLEPINTITNWIFSFSLLPVFIMILLAVTQIFINISKEEKIKRAKKRLLCALIILAVGLLPKIAIIIILYLNRF